MLLGLIALVIGAIIGLLRGGRWSSLIAAPVRGKAFLVAGVASSLVLATLDPSMPVLWSTVALVAFIGFGASNLTMSGVIVFMVGLLCNLAVLLANGAVPVSERALTSVDRVDDRGAAIIEGAHESTETARRLGFLADVVPVPVIGAVVSLGDLIALVGAADIITNLLVRRRGPGGRREDDIADTSGAKHAHASGRIANLGIFSLFRTPPAHAPEEHEPTPAHAASPSETTTEQDPAPAAPIPAAQVSPDQRPPVVDPTVKLRRRVVTTRPTDPVAADSDDEMIDLRDRRPIIDLTVSPSDEQLAEFLRRRREADRRSSAGHDHIDDRDRSGPRIRRRRRKLIESQ